MAPLIVLLAVFGLLFGPGRLVWPSLRSWVLALRGALAAMFFFTGISHFGAFGVRDDLVAIVPNALPAPEMLVTVTGVLELAGAVGLLVPQLWPWAAAGLAALLVAMFPANVYKALQESTVDFGQELLPRTVLQVVFLAAALALVRQHIRARRRLP